MDRISHRPPASNDPHGQPWTATRCHRLLRPLLSHISALRKEANRRRATESLEHEVCQNDGLVSTYRSGLKRHSAGSADVGSRISQKRVRHTYSLKAAKRIKSREEPASYAHDTDRISLRRHSLPAEGVMYLATPVVRKVQGEASSPVDLQTPIQEGILAPKSGRCDHSHRLCAHRCFFETKLAALRQTTPPSTFAPSESIYRALDSLLRATSAQKPPSAGPKSLMAVCLRKVPDYLAELESWRLQELEDSGTGSIIDDSSISFELYSDLENLGTGKSGWKHLASVVQSHGIRIVKDAISDGLINDDFAFLLVELCSQINVVSDRRQLVEAVVTRQYPKSCGPENSFSFGRANISPLCLLRPLRENRWATPFRTALMTDLLSNGLLSWEWMQTKDFGNFWSAAVKDLASRTAHPGTVSFFITSLQLLCNETRQPERRAPPSETAAQQILISSLSALSTLVILGQETQTTSASSSWSDKMETTCRRAEYITRSCLANISGSPGGNRHRFSTYVLLLANFFMRGLQSTPGTEQHTSGHENILAKFWTTVENGADKNIHRQYYEATMAMIASIARAAVRRNIHKPAANLYLMKLCDRLESLCTRMKSLRDLRVNAAFYLADRTGDLWDLNFAESLAAKRPAVRKTVRNTPGKGTSFDGFRWDDGISEWVTVTPVQTRRKGPERLLINDRVLRPRDPNPKVQNTAGRHTSDTLSASETSTVDTLKDVCDVLEEKASSIVRASSTTGTSRHAKRSATQHVSTTTHDKPGVQTREPGPRARDNPETVDGASVIDGCRGDDDVDELLFDQVAQENRPSRKRAARSDISVKRKRSRRSLVSLRPPRNMSSEYYDDGSSGDELAM